jgi:hypothetical protein
MKTFISGWNITLRNERMEDWDIGRLVSWEIGANKIRGSSKSHDLRRTFDDLVRRNDHTNLEG